MSGGSSDSQEMSTSQNISTAFLANLFGQPAFFGPQGVVFGQPPLSDGRGGGKFDEGPSAVGPDAARFFSGNSPGQAPFPTPVGGGPASGMGFANQVFFPGDFDSLSNLTKPTPRNELQDAALGLGVEGVEASQRGFANIEGPGNEAIREGLQTGFRTDINPIVAAEQRRFTQETVPNLVEQFAGLTGGFSSDLQAGLANASADLGVTLGSQQVQLDEAANARRLNALTVAPQAQQTISGIPGFTAQSALGLGSAIQEDQHLSRPEVQLLKTLSNIFGLGDSTLGAAGSSSSKQGGV